MNCLSKDELIDHLFGKDRSAGAAAEAHFAACAACRSKMEALKRLEAAAASVPPAPVSADFTARLMERLETPAPATAFVDTPSVFGRLFSPAWGFGFAAFAVAMYAGIVFLAGPRAPRPASAEALYFSDGPATVNSGLRAPGGVPGGSRAAYVYADTCETAKCGIL